MWRRPLLALIMKQPKRRPEDNEPEVARLLLHLRELPTWAVFALSTDSLIKFLNLDLNKTTVYVVVKDFRKSLEGKMAGRGKKEQTQIEAAAQPVEEIGAQVVLERIARITTKTYAHLGDGEQIGSEEASLLVYNELKTFDPAIITRNEKRALPKQTPTVTNSSARS